MPGSRRRTVKPSLSKLPALLEDEEGSETATQTWLAEMKCSGEAFVVMKQEADVEAFFSSWDQPRGLQRTGSFFSFHDGSPVPNLSPTPSWKKTRRDRIFRGCELEIREVTSEPTSIIWEHMGTSHLQLALRICIGLIGFLLAIALFYGLLPRGFRCASTIPEVHPTHQLGGALCAEVWQAALTLSDCRFGHRRGCS